MPSEALKSVISIACFTFQFSKNCNQNIHLQRRPNMHRQNRSGENTWKKMEKQIKIQHWSRHVTPEQVWALVKFNGTWRKGGKWVTSKKVNIDFYNGYIKNGNIEFTIDFFNIDSKNRVKRGPQWGGGWGWLLMMMRMLWPHLTPF